MIIYHFDNSGFYTGQTSEAPVDKLLTILKGETRYLVLRGTTSAIPPIPDIGTWPRWTGEEWELSESYKGEYIWVGNAKIKCSYHGPLQNGHSLTPPVEIAEKVARAQFKKARDAAVSALTVTVDGMEFDADEKSQSRMLNAIQAALSLNSPVIPFWVLSDNSVAENIPVDTMKMAHAQALLAMSSVWLQ